MYMKIGQYQIKILIMLDDIKILRHLNGTYWNGIVHIKNNQ